MNPARWEQVKRLLDEAIAVAPSERNSFLTVSCHDDSELRREVESLLSSHNQAGSGFMFEPAANLAAAAIAVSPARERRIGPYEIVEEIGRGGMGEVYRAARVDGHYTQEVAIKLVRGGFESSSLMERFRNERQILASLDHPHIARLVDGGATNQGVPYLVMELVRGVPIDEYCEARKLSIGERLQLFRRVCEAVQYAHQRLIIHRDIKPGNILVTPEGLPKLLDFGIAKLLDASAHAEHTAARPMTPEYASPEQIRGDPITTATDVYSLGMVLYGLLTAESPYPGNISTPHGLARAICDEEPLRPSAVVLRNSGDSANGRPTTAQAISNSREDTAIKLQRRLAGDLDNIVFKALQKEPARRYSSVEQFSEDLRRHLEHIPIVARPDTVIYRAGKFVRRHRVGVATAALLIVVTITGLAMILQAERKARAQQAIAERRFNDVRKLANSLMFEIHDSLRTLPGATAARQLTIQRAQEYLDSLAPESKSDPGLLSELAAAYARLASVQGEVTNANVGNSQEALKNYRRAVELREAAVAASPHNRDRCRELADSYLDLAKTEITEAERKTLVEKATALLQALEVSDPADLKIQFALASAFELRGAAYTGAGNWKEAQANYEKALAIYGRLVQVEPSNHRYQSNLAFAHKHVGANLIMQNQLQPALDQYRAALAIDEAQLKADPQNAGRRYNITFTYSDTGYILRKQGDTDGALNYYRKALAIRKALADADPKDTHARGGMATTYSYIAGLLLEKGETQEAVAAYKEALSIREALSHNDPSNAGKRLDAAKSEEDIADAYQQMAFSPRIGNRRRLALCIQAESFAQQAIPVLRDGKDKLIGTEVGYLSDAETIADRCSREIVRLQLQGVGMSKPATP
jgi:non-specific serine/threonine protein kinase/serine/threonine-protein kinase